MLEILEMDEVVFAKTTSRSVVGSMKDIITQAKFSYDYHDMDVDSPAMFESLSQIPLKANSYYPAGFLLQVPPFSPSCHQKRVVEFGEWFF